jgi:LemA protein
MQAPMIIVVLIVPIGAYMLSIYSKFVTFKNRVMESWSDVEVQMRRSYDLIPNLVETVKSYASHEKNTLDAVIKVRNTAVSVTGIEDKAKAENVLSGHVKISFCTIFMCLWIFSSSFN